MWQQGICLKEDRKCKKIPHHCAQPSQNLVLKRQAEVKPVWRSKPFLLHSSMTRMSKCPRLQRFFNNKRNRFFFKPKKPSSLVQSYLSFTILPGLKSSFGEQFGRSFVCNLLEKQVWVGLYLQSITAFGPECVKTGYKANYQYLHHLSTSLNEKKIIIIKIYIYSWHLSSEMLFLVVHTLL